MSGSTSPAPDDAFPLSFGELNSQPIVVAIGPPGAGKTAEMYRWHTVTAGSVWLNLSQMTDADSVAREMSGATSGAVVFIDGCDEFDGNAAALLNELGRRAEGGVQLRITARESWWYHHRHLTDRLADAMVVSLDPLDGAGAGLLLDSCGCDRAGLISAFEFGSTDLVANPRLLVAWARIVERDRAPANRRELYERVTALAADESNKVLARLTHGRRDSAAVLALAQRAAALSTVSRRSTLVVDVDAEGGERLNIATLRGIVKDPVSTAVWLVASPLLVPAGDGWLFADRTTAEFLAAAELSRCIGGERADERWRQLLSTVIGSERFVPPVLRGVAAWAAEHEPAAFDVLLTIDPSVLVEQPGARYSRSGHLRLFELLLGDDLLLRQVSHQAGLLAACIDAVDDGRQRLTYLASSAGEDQPARRRALEMISSSGLRAFDSVAASVVCDTTAPPVLRYWAMLTVAETNDFELLRGVYNTVVANNAPDDPELRVFGMALNSMWPDHLSVDELVQVLRPPTSDGLLEYEFFLSAQLPRSMRPADAAPVLRWMLTTEREQWRRRRADLTLTTLVSQIADIMSGLSDTIVRRDIVAVIAEGTATLSASVDAATVRKLLAALTSDELMVIADACVASTVEQWPWSAAGTLLGHLATHPDPVTVSTLRVAIVGRIDSATSDSIAQVWLRALTSTWQSGARDAAIVARAAAMGAAHAESVRAIIDAPDATPAEPPPPIPSSEDSVVLQLRMIAAGKAKWGTIVVPNIHSSHAFGGLWDGVRRSSIGADADDVLEVARLAASETLDPIEPDRDSIPGDLLAWGYAAETIAWLQGVNSAASVLAVNADAAVRCRRWITSRPFVDALRIAALARSGPFTTAITAEIEHVARCERCHGRLDWLLDLPDEILTEVDPLIRRLAVDPTIQADTRVNVVRALTARQPLAPVDVGEILGAFSGTDRFGQAVVDLQAGQWHRPSLNYPDEDRRDLVKTLASAIDRSDGAISLSDTTDSALADLYRDATRLFSRGSFATFGTVENAVDALRNRCIGELVNRGSGAIDTLLALAESSPLADLVGAERLRQLLETHWAPLPPEKVAIVLDEPDCAVLTTTDDVVAAIRRALIAYQKSLHATGGGLELLREHGKPRSEQTLSIDLLRFLRTWFGGQSVVADREVELRPIAEWRASGVDPPPWTGERADILVHAIGPDRTFAVVIELKGSWNAEWGTAAQTQLVDRYLVHPDVDGGIYVVFWFDRDSWPTDDARRARSPASVTVVQSKLDEWNPSGVIKPVLTFVVNAGIAPTSL